jgi:transcriptional regulator with AAA-type ATPase domain
VAAFPRALKSYLVLENLAEHTEWTPASLERLRAEVASSTIRRVIVIDEDTNGTAARGGPGARFTPGDECFIRVPPLAERREDIPELALHFLHRTCLQFERRLLGLELAALELLKRYDWGGNVRELELVVRAAVLMCPDDDRLRVSDFRRVGV